jgi:WD40 repeat protein
MEYLGKYFDNPEEPKSHCLPVTTVAFLPDLNWIVSASWDNTLKVWSILTGKEIFTLRGHTNTVKDITVIINTDLVVSVSSDQTLKVWDLKKQKVIANFIADNRLNCCAMAPDGVTIVAGEASGRLHFLRLENVDKL